MVQSGSGVSRSRHQFVNAFRLAFDSIRSHKLRSFLTLLGVIIGVASVIMVGAAIGIFTRRGAVRWAIRQVVITGIAAGVTYGVGRGVGTG